MLTQRLKSLPAKSGVYQFFNKESKLLYVGKAKVLKNRVKSYFKLTPELTPAKNLSPRIHKMISEVESLEYIVVENEFDALILENSLIKQLKPKYNILLRDDKTYPYIYVDNSLKYPRFEITRRIKKGIGVEYFGPYTQGARDILDSIYESFKLVQNSSCLRGKKACLFYQIKKCLAPCEGLISEDEYKKIVKVAKEHIKNKNLLIKALEKRMLEYSEALRFEEAGRLRDRIEKIKSLKDVSLDLAGGENLDIFYIQEGEKRAVLVKLFIRDGKVVSSTNSSIPQNDAFELKEAYKRALLSAYAIKSPLPPSSILVPMQIEDQSEIEELISSTMQKKVKILIPKIGDKKRLLEVAKKNAQELQKNIKTDEDIGSKLQELLELENYPDRIEVYDTSMLFGKHRVGAMVVYEDEFCKSEYRHYNLEEKNEYAMMQEMLTRRALSFETNPPPSLWLIDGGKAQLNLAKDIINSSGANVDVVAIAKEKIDAKAHRAKGAAKDIIYFKDEVLRLDVRDKRLQFLQKLRDEAHRFAVTFHRKQKLKEDRDIEILKVHGVGQASVKRLLDYFGSFEKIFEASLEELEGVVSRSVAIKILDFVKNRD